MTACGPSKVAALDGGQLGRLLGHPRREIRAAAAEALASKGTARTRSA